MKTKTLEYYLDLPYKTEIIKDNDPDNPGWVARVVDLPGCLTQADTFPELEEMIADAKRLWIETALEDGIEIPEPRPEEEYSGKFVVRVPKSLHRRLVEIAEREAISLNQYVSVALGLAVGENITAVPATKLEPLIPSWPGLSVAATRVLQMAGLTNQAADVDERLFSEWAGHRIERITAAYRSGYSRELFEDIDTLLMILRQNTSNSPVINVYVQTLSFLRQVCDDALKRTSDVQLLAQLGQVIYQVNQSNQIGADLKSGYLDVSNEFETLPESRRVTEDKDRY